MSRTLTRRTAMGATAALATLATPSIVTLAAAYPSVDAVPASAVSPDLLQLVAQLEQKWAEIETLNQESRAADNEHRRRQLPLPDVLKHRAGDKELGLPDPIDKWKPGYYTTMQLNQLRQHKSTRDVLIPISQYKRELFAEKALIAIAVLDEEAFIVTEINPKAKARRDEIIAALEAWEADDDVIARELGVDTFDDKMDALIDAESDLLDKIAAFPVCTADDTLAQARVLYLWMTPGLWLSDEHASGRLVTAILNNFAKFGGFARIVEV